jgi:cullin-associated NEDD8-dissociated protein 1
LYALLETLYPYLPIPAFYDRVVAGLTDDNDIRTICTLILLKLLQLAPEETHSRLEALAGAFRQVLGVRPKENAVKMEIERIQEGHKSVLKLSLAVQKAFGVGGEKTVTAAGGDVLLGSWQTYWEWARKEFAGMVELAEDELKGKDR